jgi:hypothetical protein
MNEIAVYPDGSGKASEKLAWALKNLKEREGVINALRAFIDKNHLTLQGLDWDIAMFDQEIELNWHYCCGKPTTATDVARLFRGLKWKRVKTRYGSKNDLTRDWMSQLDGVNIRIKNAETFKVVKVITSQSSGKFIDLEDEE